MKAKYHIILTLFAWQMLAISTTSCAQHPDQELTLQLKSVDVHLVKPVKPYQYRTDKNELKTVAQAYLVLFDFEKIPPVTNERTDFYIGDYRIPEYGGTKTGIYFRIYDPAIVNRLNNQPISWKKGNQPQKTFPGKVFTADTRKLKPESEEAVLKAKY